MLHFVEPNKTNEDRISLAFNIMIEPTNEWKTKQT
jgi:hypothetical protein